MIKVNRKQLNKLSKFGIDIWGNSKLIPPQAKFEPPCATKNCELSYMVELGAFSYAVSGYMSCVKIGRYCSFGEDIQIGRQAHPVDWLSTSPFTYMKNTDVFECPPNFHHLLRHDNNQPVNFGHSQPPATKVQHTIIGHDVWIGHGAFLKPGIKVGTGAMIAAGSVVTKDVPSYALVGGNPGRIIRYRFDEETITKLLESRWWQYTPKDLAALPAHKIHDFLSALEEQRANFTVYSPKKILIGGFNFG
ncbi:MAG: CatB-related O-acetyltransferase [Pseudomonadales bacterium]